jgi:hypothetical protein
MTMKKLTCLVSALTLLGFVSICSAGIKDRLTVPEDAATFVIGTVHDVTDYYQIPTEGDPSFEQYLAQDPGGKIRGIAYYYLTGGGYIEFSVTGSISGGPAPKAAVVKLTYKALAVTEGSECEVGTCLVPASGSVKGDFTVVSCTEVPCVGTINSSVVVLSGSLNGSVKVSGTTVKISESFSTINGATDRGSMICKAIVQIDAYPTAVKYNCTDIASMKYNAIGYVTFDSGIKDIVIGSGTFDSVKGSKFTVGNCYGKITITITRAVDPCDTCNYYAVATVTGKLAGQSVSQVISFVVNTDNTFWSNLVYMPVGLPQ